MYTQKNPRPFSRGSLENESEREAYFISSAWRARLISRVILRWKWAGMPVKNVSKTPLVSGQWQRKGSGFDLVITQNETAPDIPVGGTLELL